MHTLTISILVVVALIIVLAFFGARTTWKNRPTVRKTPPPSVPPIYGGNIMEEVRRELLSKLYSISLN